MSFFPGWLAQAMVSFVVAFVVVGPVFRITIQNAHRSVSAFEIGVLMLLLLIPFWAIQLVAIPGVIRTTSTVKKWLVWLGAYVVGIGPAIAIAYVLAGRMASTQASKIATSVVLTVGLVLGFLFLCQIYSVTIGDVVVQAILQ